MTFKTWTNSKSIVNTLEYKLDLDFTPINPASDGCKTQEYWIKYWNAREDNIYFASMSDLYQYFKKLKHITESGSETEKAKASVLVDDLRKDFNSNDGLVSSTRLEYNINPTNGWKTKIIHHYNSKNPSLIKETILDVDDYCGVDIAEVVHSTNGLRFLQTYFGTRDDALDIMETVEFINGKNRNYICVWTPNTESRVICPDVAAFLRHYVEVTFNISGHDTLSYNHGRSRGVKYVKSKLVNDSTID